MDKVLAFSIPSASSADIAQGTGAGGSWARLSWRGRKQQQDDDHQAGAGQQGGGGCQPAEAAEQGKSPPRRPRFAPEFDGIDCFETIVWR